MKPLLEAVQNSLQGTPQNDVRIDPSRDQFVVKSRRHREDQPVLDAFVADKLSQKEDPPERTEYYLMLARTYLKEIDNEQAMLARIQAIEEEIYRINQPTAYAYSLEMSRA